MICVSVMVGVGGLMSIRSLYCKTPCPKCKKKRKKTLEGTLERPLSISGLLLRDLVQGTISKETILFTVDPYYGN